MKDIKVMGFDLKMFIVIAAVIIASCALGVLPEGMVGDKDSAEHSSSCLHQY